MLPFATVNNPTKRIPYITYGLIFINIAVFLWQTRIPPADAARVYFELAAVPCGFVGNFFRGMFMHGDVWHLIGNMTFLWLFGTNAEDFLGRRSFTVFYLVGGLAAALTHIVLYSQQCTVLIGASGAVSAVLGAYLVLYPGTRVRAGIPFFRFFYFPVTVPAWMLLGLWFILQVISGTMALNGAGSRVAFFAHIGGFMFGFLFAFVYTMFKGAPESVIYDD